MSEVELESVCKMSFRLSVHFMILLILIGPTGFTHEEITELIREIASH